MASLHVISNPMAWDENNKKKDKTTQHTLAKNQKPLSTKAMHA